MDLEEAQGIISNLLEVEKQEKPDKRYGELYNKILAQVKKILPHADEDYLPEHLIENRAPNATDEQVSYIRKNWKATTNPVFHELLNVIQRGFIDDNWQIIWEDEDFQEYCEDMFPEYGSLESFIKEVAPPIKYTDANAVLAVRPKGFSYIVEDGEYVVDEDGGLIVDDTQELEPALYVYPSERVLIRDEEFYLVVDEEKSLVEYNAKKVRDGRVLYLYTKNEIYKIVQVGKKVDNRYETFLYFAHDEGVVPATEFKGIPKKLRNGKLMQVSPFRYATDLLDLALTNKNYLQISVNNVVFPFRVMMADKCTFANEEGRCDGGKWVSNDNGLHVGNCSKCKGTGQNTPYSPLGVYLWDKEHGLNGQGNLPFKPVEFVEAPTSGLEFVQSLVDSDTDKAKDILHLQKSEAQNTSSNKTATETVYNDNGQISFVRYNVHQLFDLWLWALNRISFQRYESYDEVPELIYPRTFDFRSETDIWNQIKTARESEAPVSIMHDLFKSLLNNLYASSPNTQKVFDTILGADKLFALSEMQIASRKASNTIEGWEVVLHDSGVQLVEQLMRDDVNYLDLELQVRIEKLIDLAKNSIFEVQTTDPVQQIIQNNE